MKFQRPVVAYVAATNVEAHLVVEMLTSNGIAAHAVEDQSGVSLWALGTISQFHKPKVWIDESSAENAALLMQAFGAKKRQSTSLSKDLGEIETTCHKCGH